jgi:hypothetical protein
MTKSSARADAHTHHKTEAKKAKPDPVYKLSLQLAAAVEAEVEAEAEWREKAPDIYAIGRLRMQRERVECLRTALAVTPAKSLAGLQAHASEMRETIERMSDYAIGMSSAAGADFVIKGLHNLELISERVVEEIRKFACQAR